VIGLLRGTIVRHGVSDLVVDVNGVGYRIVASSSTIAALTGTGGEVAISVHTHVREDAIVLFGFINDAEREVFEILLGTHGVGPSLALAILGTLGASGVVVAVQNGDSAAFETVSGVGKKTAARLVLELQDSLSSHSLSDEIDVMSAEGHQRERSEVSAALAELGYSNDEIKDALGALDGTETLEQALRLALRQLSRP
jgi:holliday junction DNA helicase RuvA